MKMEITPSETGGIMAEVNGSTNAQSKTPAIEIVRQSDGSLDQEDYYAHQIKLAEIYKKFPEDAFETQSALKGFGQDELKKSGGEINFYVNGDVFVRVQEKSIRHDFRAYPCPGENLCDRPKRTVIWTDITSLSCKTGKLVITHVDSDYDESYSKTFDLSSKWQEYYDTEDLFVAACGKSLAEIVPEKK